jgi:hypothetical protein
MRRSRGNEQYGKWIEEQPRMKCHDDTHKTNRVASHTYRSSGGGMIRTDAALLVL